MQTAEVEIEEVDLVNVELVKGKCVKCLVELDEKWCGKNPALGTRCSDCQRNNIGGPIFEPKNVQLSINPGKFKKRTYNYNGTKVKVNGKIGITTSTYGNYSFVNFHGDSFGGIAIKGLGYQDLLRIHAAEIEVDPAALEGR